MTPLTGVEPRSYVPQEALFLWALINPAQPVLVGELRLSPLVADGATFAYAPGWWHFPLSEDLPLLSGHRFTAGERGSAPGAIDDARPDRWGERIIRHIDRPARLSILEMLLFAGDDRFGALGVSIAAEAYVPRALGPYPQLRDLATLSTAIDELQAHAPIPPQWQRLLQPGVTLGGAQPKALLQTEPGPCLVKFSELDDPVDTPLIEHATMTLAAQAGIQVAATGVLPLPARHGKARHALTPAYDVVPTLQNLGYQSLAVGSAGAESSLDNALTELSEFGIARPRAIALIQQVARTVDQWATHFVQQGVCPADMEQLRASIDRDALLTQRKAFC